jgi:hypothetical protein
VPLRLGDTASHCRGRGRDHHPRDTASADLLRQTVLSTLAITVKKRHNN